MSKGKRVGSTLPKRDANVIFTRRAALMSFVGCIPALERSIARILDAQRRSDDQHLAQAILLLRGQYHARYLRIDGEFRQPPA